MRIYIDLTKQFFKWSHTNKVSQDNNRIMNDFRINSEQDWTDNFIHTRIQQQDFIALAKESF